MFLLFWSEPIALVKCCHREEKRRGKVEEKRRRGKVEEKRRRGKVKEKRRRGKVEGVKKGSQMLSQGRGRRKK